MRQGVANFANFVCRFGDESVLLDYAEQVIIPAFTDPNLTRKVRKTEYLFDNCKLENIIFRGQSHLAITGRLVKNVLLEREQVYDKNTGITKKYGGLRSSPSAFFVLSLKDHRLTYFAETPHAPDFKAFKATISRFISEKHILMINRMYDEHAKEGKDARRTKTSLYKEHPRPHLSVIPISGTDEIDKFIDRYKTLKTVTFKLVKPNDEFDAEEIFNSVRDITDEMGSTSTKVETRNKDGMNLAATKKHVKSATQTANQEVTLAGIDQDGHELRGDNKEFQISAPIDEDVESDEKKVQALFSTYQALKENKTINVGKYENEEKIIEKIEHLKQTILQKR